MTRSYLTRRVLMALVVALFAATAAFVIGQVLGDPVSLRYPDMSADRRAEVEASIGLDRPAMERYWDFLAGIPRGWLGTSIWQKRPVHELILARIPATVILATSALAIAIPTAIALGVGAALRVGSALDRLVTALSLAGVSLVHFWFGLMLVIVFAVNFGFFPTSGYGTVSHVVLPAITLAVRPIGRIAQFTRNAMLEEMNSVYVLMARARGLPEHRVVIHAFRNATIPVLTILADDFTDLLSGSVIVETVFAWPGIGFLLIQGITQRDLPIVTGVALVIALLVVTVNLLVDVVYRMSDPKIRYA